MLACRSDPTKMGSSMTAGTGSARQAGTTVGAKREYVPRVISPSFAKRLWRKVARPSLDGGTAPGCRRKEKSGWFGESTWDLIFISLGGRKTRLPYTHVRFLAPGLQQRPVQKDHEPSEAASWNSAGRSSDTSGSSGLGFAWLGSSQWPHVALHFPTALHCPRDRLCAHVAGERTSQHAPAAQAVETSLNSPGAGQLIVRCGSSRAEAATPTLLSRRGRGGVATAAELLSWRRLLSR